MLALLASCGQSCLQVFAGDLKSKSEFQKENVYYVQVVAIGYVIHCQINGTVACATHQLSNFFKSAVFRD